MQGYCPESPLSTNSLGLRVWRIITVVPEDVKGVVPELALLHVLLDGVGLLLGGNLHLGASNGLRVLGPGVEKERRKRRERRSREREREREREEEGER